MDYNYLPPRPPSTKFLSKGKNSVSSEMNTQRIRDFVESLKK